MGGLKFVDLFAGLGGFHVAMARLGHECAFASELDDDLRELYLRNFPNMAEKVFGDIRHVKDRVPRHDVLCAGFPCQPFSKSGSQLGVRDETRGTLFHEILDILEKWQPQFVLLENVGNFGRHDSGRTWSIVRQRLEDLGYHVAGTEHVTPRSQRDWRDVGSVRVPNSRPIIDTTHAKTSGTGLISPHHFGFPHHRERFYVYASLTRLGPTPFPAIQRNRKTDLSDIVQQSPTLTNQDIAETKLTAQQLDCISHWNSFVQALPSSLELPSFPMWGDEIGATYPYELRTPWSYSPKELGMFFVPPFPPHTRREYLFQQLPSYAREEVAIFRAWKVRYIKQNREWWSVVSKVTSKSWIDKLRQFPPSLRKLEWNVKGEERDLWAHVLQFRPSGLRVKRSSSSPALVAMTATQIPILGPERRFLSRLEGQRLQGFPDDHKLPISRESAFKALGNAVHVGVIMKLAKHLIESPPNAAPVVASSRPRRTYVEATSRVPGHEMAK